MQVKHPYILHISDTTADFILPKKSGRNNQFPLVTISSSVLSRDGHTNASFYLPVICNCLWII